MKVNENRKLLTHNQVVAGSSPAGTTKRTPQWSPFFIFTQ